MHLTGCYAGCILLCVMLDAVCLQYICMNFLQLTIGSGLGGGGSTCTQHVVRKRRQHYIYSIKMYVASIPAYYSSYITHL